MLSKYAKALYTTQNCLLKEQKPSNKTRQIFASSFSSHSANNQSSAHQLQLLQNFTNHLINSETWHNRAWREPTENMSFSKTYCTWPISKQETTETTHSKLLALAKDWGLVKDVLFRVSSDLVPFLQRLCHDFCALILPTFKMLFTFIWRTVKKKCWFTQWTKMSSHRFYLFHCNVL